MKKNVLSKTLVIGLMILLVGASVIPTISGNDMSDSESLVISNKTTETLFEGSSYFVLLSDYDDYMGQDNKWAVQLRFDSAQQVVECEFDGFNLPLVMDQWVEIRVDIDLDGDWMEIYYNGDFLHEKEWTADPNNQYGGILNIGAVDLFANGASSVYYDDLTLEQEGVGEVWSDNFDSYADGSSIHGQGGWKGWDNDEKFTAYVTSAISSSSPHSVDVAGDSDLVHEYEGYTSGLYTFTAWLYIPTEQPDLYCVGSLSWTDVGPGTTVEGDFSVKNIGDEGSELNWEIESYPDWGTWTFTPDSGEGLTPEDDPVTVNVEVVAPDEQNEEFTGNVTVVNSDSPGDRCTIPVTLKTPKNKPFDFNLNLLSWLFERFPYAFPIFRYMLGV